MGINPIVSFHNFIFVSLSLSERRMFLWEDRFKKGGCMRKTTCALLIVLTALMVYAICVAQEQNEKWRDKIRKEAFGVVAVTAKPRSFVSHQVDCRSETEKALNRFGLTTANSVGVSVKSAKDQ